MNQSFKPSSDFLRETQARGFLDHVTHLDTLDRRLNQGPVVAYLGFDATAESLHVGSLVMIMWLRWLQKTGHKPLVLMGGGRLNWGILRIRIPCAVYCPRPLLIPISKKFLKVFRPV